MRRVEKIVTFCVLGKIMGSARLSADAAQSCAVCNCIFTVQQGKALYQMAPTGFLPRCEHFPAQRFLGMPRPSFDRGRPVLSENERHLAKNT